jgi:hypothetical protein
VAESVHQSAASSFFAELHQIFAQQPGIRRCHYWIGGELVRLSFGCSGIGCSPLEQLLTPALAHRETNGAGQTVALEVFLFDGESSPTARPTPPWGADCYGRRGEIVGFNDDRFHTVYQPGLDILQMFDRQASEAFYWAPTWRRVPYWEQSFPLRSILHWWCGSRPWVPVHAGAVGSDGAGVLIAGKSGSGKSTSTLACLEAGLGYAGDDYVLVGDHPAPRVESLYGTAKLVPDNLSRFPRLRELVVNAGRLDEEKALLFVNQSHAESMMNEMELRAIVVPRVTGLRDSRVLRVSPQAAVFAIAPTTIFQLPGGGTGVMDKVARVARRVPAYALEAGTDLPQIPALIRSLLSREVAHAGTV